MVCIDFVFARLQLGGLLDDLVVWFACCVGLVVVVVGWFCCGACFGLFCWLMFGVVVWVSRCWLVVSADCGLLFICAFAGW